MLNIRFSHLPSTLHTNSIEQFSPPRTIDLSALASGGSEMFWSGISVEVDFLRNECQANCILRI